MKDMQLRAWDKKRKKMFNIITWNDPRYLAFDVTATGQSSDSLIELEKEDIVLMQFIEIKDINDKDIYEGDRIKCSTRYNKVDIEHIGIVLFERGTFIVGADTFTDSYMTFIELNSDWELEVIGHKYDGEIK